MRRALVLSLFALVLAGAARADDPPCADPPDARAPDPRCGEPLDGRPPAAPPAALTVPRLVLEVPRLASHMVFWPVTRTGDFLEHHQVPQWMQALLTSDDGKVGVRPELEYTSGFVPRAGLRLFYQRLGNSELGADVRTAGPTAIQSELSLRLPAPGLTARAAWSTLNDRLFAGIGPNREAELDAQGHGLGRYGVTNMSAELDWSRALPLRLVAQAHGDVERRDYRATGVRGGPSVADLYGLPADQCPALGLGAPCPDPAALPGFSPGLRLAHLGGGLLFDARSKARDGSGATLGVDASYAQGLGADPSQHLRLSAETLLALGADDRLLFVRARAAMVERLRSAPVPFEELVMPAYKAEMRGFPVGRFRGESGLFATAEYRWLIAFNIDAGLFVDLGTVASREFSGLHWDRLFPSYGLELRYYSVRARYWDGVPLGGLQLAYAPDGGFRLLLALTPY